jgi:hypothetical protein
VKDDGSPASQCATGTLAVKVYPTPSYPDIRVRVCPDAGVINLAKYIDTTDIITDIQWTSQIPGVSISSPAGEISTDNLISARVYTFTYSVTSQCVSEQKRKFYLEMLRNNKMRPLKDTIAICYLYAEAVNVNQLFGLEANGAWSYFSQTAGDVDAYVMESTSGKFKGAVTMNGKDIYEDDDISAISYHGVNAKTVKFTYTTAANGCLKGKSYSVVIVLTEDIMR